MHAAAKRYGRKGLIGAAFLIAFISFGDLLFPPPLHRGEAYSPLAVDREGRWLHAFTTPEGRWRFAVDLNDIDPIFVERLLAVEDKRFYGHAGVDVAALARASLDAVRTGRIRSGASTITMQTARLLEPRPRTVPSKLIEIVRAAQLERRLSKREILELYLTLAPYGGNLEGARAASLAYFGKEPARLTDAEQALLIALPQAPEARRPDRSVKRATDARAKILKKLAASGALTPERAREAQSAPLVSTRNPFPRSAYHTTRRLVQSENFTKGVLETSLDLAIQHEAERLVRAHAAQAQDGATASLMVIVNDTREVRASVGSSGVTAPGGWIDLTRAVRSPGSTLKPLIYALAFEDGLVGPDTVIDDMPRAFGDYAPENFDRTFRGEVRVKDALQHSLNLPAVSLLDRLGAPRFAALIKSTGAPLRNAARADKQPGLALALGGAGMTAQDLGVLYAALANGGEAHPLQWTSATTTTDASTGRRLFSEENAARIAQILKDAPALAGRAPSALSTSAPRVAFKTGTSYGYRDAWAAGYNDDYTVIAWVGRADGAPRPGVTGRKAAAPLLMDMFDALTAGEQGVNEAPSREEANPPAIALRAGVRGSGPEIIFPRTGVELFASNESDRGFSLAARGGVQNYRWYVSGAPVSVDATSGRAIWRPDKPGFYDVLVVDGRGRQARSKVRVRLSG